MITLEQQKESVELMNSLIEKAWENANFKEQLIKNPASAIESVTGKKINDQIKFVVEDQSDSSFVYFNIPKKVELESLELTDEQLEMISGGEVGVSVTVAIAIGGAFLTGMGVGVAIYAAVN